MFYSNWFIVLPFTFRSDCDIRWGRSQDTFFSTNVDIQLIQSHLLKYLYFSCCIAVEVHLSLVRYLYICESVSELYSVPFVSGLSLHKYSSHQLLYLLITLLNMVYILCFSLVYLWLLLVLNFYINFGVGLSIFPKRPARILICIALKLD